MCEREKEKHMEEKERRKRRKGGTEGSQKRESILHTCHEAERNLSTSHTFSFLSLVRWADASEKMPAAAVAVRRNKEPATKTKG